MKKKSQKLFDRYSILKIKPLFFNKSYGFYALFYYNNVSHVQNHQNSIIFSEIVKPKYYN